MDYVQLIGAFAILLAYAFRNRWHPRLYLGVNMVGSVLLLAASLIPDIQPGFVVLNVFWIVVSAFSLLKEIKKRA